MTKQNFIKFYELFTQLVKQGVDGEYYMSASAKLVNYCGGYTLELHPQCLMWGSDFVLLEGLCHRFNLSLEVYMQAGVILIW